MVTKTFCSFRYFSIFSCDQAALWMVQYACLSVCLSVCSSVTPFWLCSHHRIIMKFSRVITDDRSDVHAKGEGQKSKVKVTVFNTHLSRFWVITNDRSDVHAKGQGQRSKVKVTEFKTHLSRSRVVTPVWIHVWWWNGAQSLMLLRRGALLSLVIPTPGKGSYPEDDAVQGDNYLLVMERDNPLL